MQWASYSVTDTLPNLRWSACAQSPSRVWLFVTPWTTVLCPSVLGIFQARILEWVSISFSRGSSWTGIEPASSASPALTGRFFTTEPPGEIRLLFPFTDETAETQRCRINFPQSSLAVVGPRFCLWYSKAHSSRPSCKPMLRPKRILECLYTEAKTKGTTEWLFTSQPCLKHILNDFGIQLIPQQNKYIEGAAF